MAVDLKYGRVTLERGTIAEDEPVVVFRARDELLPELLSRYADLCREADSPAHHLAAVERSLDAVQAWQEAHEDQVRVPRSDPHDPLEAARSALVTALETGTSSLGLVDLEALVPLMRLLGVPTGRLEGPSAPPAPRRSYDPATRAQGPAPRG